MASRETDILARIQEAAGGDELLAGDPSPGGLHPLQAEVLKRSRARGTRFQPGRELSGVERAVGRFAFGAGEELFLGRGEGLGTVSRETRDLLNVEGFDVGDIADVAGRLMGALPAAIATGGAASIGARALARSIAKRLPRAARAIVALTQRAPADASRFNRIASSATANIYEGLAFTAVTAPARKLEEGQTRARQIGTEFGIGVAADFMLGLAFGSAGARLGNVADAMKGSDNDIDRQIGLLMEGKLADADAANAAGEPIVQARATRVVDPGTELVSTQPARGAPDDIPEAEFSVERGGELAAPEEAAVLRGPVVDDERLLAAEAGGARLTGGEALTPEQALLREDVNVQRNLPFASRAAAPEDLAIQGTRLDIQGQISEDIRTASAAAGTRVSRLEAAGEFRAAQEAASQREVDARDLRAARELMAEDEAAEELAPTEVRPAEELEAVDEALAVPAVSARATRDILEEIQAATTEGEVATAASNLAAARLRPGERAEVEAFVAAKLEQVRGAGGAADEVPFSREPVEAPPDIPAAAAEVPPVLRDLGITENPQPSRSAVTEAPDELTPIGDLVEDVQKAGTEDPVRAEAAFRDMEDQYGGDVADDMRARTGTEPQDLEPTLAEQAGVRKRADAAARQFEVGEPIKGQDGADTPVNTEAGPLAARYRVVELDDVQASHNVGSWQANPDYFPEGAVQQRDYLRNTANRDAVVEIATKPEVRAFTDRSSFAQTGPPVLSPDGRAIAGNGRAMALKLMQQQNPEGFTAYRANLLEEAESFGLDRGAVDGMTAPVLVRELTDSGIDFANVDQMREMNIAFDQSVGKAKTSIEDAGSRAARLRDRGAPAIQHLEDTLGNDDTLRSYLWTKPGRDFVKLLREGGIITTEEAGAFIDKTGNLTEAGRDMVEQTLLVRAVGDPAVVSATPASIKARIEHAVPGIIRSQDAGDWDVSGVVREALEVHAQIDANDAFTGRTGKVVALRGQGSLFGEEASARALDVAQSIEDVAKKDVTEMFRSYFREMDIATRQGESDDLFGFEARKPEEVFDDVFGAERRANGSDVPPCR